jgi:hypothetical protein
VTYLRCQVSWEAEKLRFILNGLKARERFVPPWRDRSKIVEPAYGHCRTKTAFLAVNGPMLEKSVGTRIRPKFPIRAISDRGVFP